MLECQSSLKPRQISELEMKALPQQALPLSNADFASGNFSRENNATLKQTKNLCTYTQCSAKTTAILIIETESTTVKKITNLPFSKKSLGAFFVKL